MKRSANRMIICLIVILMLGLSVILGEIEGEMWTDNDATGFEDGISFATIVEDGRLLLEQAPGIAWLGQGESAGDNYGWTVGSAGDVNGDGFDDLIVGAPNHDGIGPNAGKFYVHLGSVWGPGRAPDDMRSGETAGDGFGFWISCAGDVNGDGYDDVVAGAPYHDGSGNDAGKVYCFHGSKSGLGVTPAWEVQGEGAGDFLGNTVRTAGDVNGDGYDDVIVASSGYDGTGIDIGKAYVYHGSPAGLGGTSAWSVVGKATGDALGWAVSTAGDVNGDGFDDVIVSAMASDAGSTDAGEAYLFLGSPSGLSSEVSWSDRGEVEGDGFGWAVSTAGDVNGDGFADVIVSSAGNDESAVDAGKVYLYLGSESGLSPAPDWSCVGESTADGLGWAIGPAGDMNGDGYGDVILGSPGNDAVGIDSGRSYAFFGSAQGLRGTPDWTEPGIGPGDAFGIALGTAGDVNGDGLDEVIIGAPQNDGAGMDTGEAYIFELGRASSREPVLRWSGYGEAEGDEFGRSVDIAGDVNGDGYDDVIVGAPDHAGTTWGEGAAYVYYGAPYGLTAEPVWKTIGEGSNNWYGQSVSSAGDVNGDGYDDVIVGAPDGPGAVQHSGAAYVYHGSAAGLSGSYDWKDGPGGDDGYGWSLASAGDVNGDGYDDVIVGAPWGDEYYEDHGAAYVYYGSASGLSTSADWFTYGEHKDCGYGFSVDGAGDLNGDGYDDVVVGSPEWDENFMLGVIGKVYVYYGSAEGLGTTSAWVDFGMVKDEVFGREVSGVGDVNGDGYDDLFIGQPWNNTPVPDAGKGYIYHGTPLGPHAGPDWEHHGSTLADAFGYAASGLGDVNGDGFDDVMFGKAGYYMWEGSMELFYGTADGLASEPAMVFNGDSVFASNEMTTGGGGDVNGDGFNDILIGTPYSSITEEGAGAALLYTYPLRIGPNFLAEGTYTSRPMSTTGDSTVEPLSLAWEPVTQPDGTSVALQIGNSDDGIEWEFFGPDGTSDTFFTVPAAIPASLEGRFWCYKINLETSVPALSPAINEVTFSYRTYTTDPGPSEPDPGSNMPPSADAGGYQEIEVNGTAILIGTGTDEDGTIVLYEWDFEGDGTYDWSSTETGITTQTYQTVGVFLAGLRITDDEGGVTLSIAPVKVEDYEDDAGNGDGTGGEPNDGEGEEQVIVEVTESKSIDYLSGAVILLVVINAIMMATSRRGKDDHHGSGDKKN